jgi:translation initiation factor IF-2
MSVQDFAIAIGRNVSDVVRALMGLGTMKSATESLTVDELGLVADALDIEIRIEDAAESTPEFTPEEELEDGETDDADRLKPRPAVVTVMGHVDHGKTSLLDRIRHANVVSGEAGGITQHIGAYQVRQGDRDITFIDTPGHEAFTAMRARGAQVTDVAVLVVAANDSVMPQTVEAINHAKAAGVPIIVAVNKVDLEDADPTRVRTDLMAHDLVSEEFGGQTIAVDVSAKSGIGIDQLLDYINLVAELEDLRANPDVPARGVCVEANLDKGRGPVATVLVKRGTLRRGDYFVAGTTWGRVRAMFDHTGSEVKEAPPSMPVLVMGFDDVPAAGDELRVVGDERRAKEIASARDRRQRQALQTIDLKPRSLESLFRDVGEGGVAKLPIIVKSDVQGSLEALTEALAKLNRDDVEIDLVHRAVGGITENDVTLAAASDAIIIGFNVRPDRTARELAEKEGVEIRTYDVIYQIIDDIGAALLGLLAPEYEEVVTGQAEVRQVFRVPRFGAIAGSYVLEGRVTRNSKARLIRDGVVVWTGQVGSLRRFKEDAAEVAAGFECGIGLAGYNDLRERDIIELFEQREVARS